MRLWITDDAVDIAAVADEATTAQVIDVLLEQGGEIQEPTWDQFSQMSLPSVPSLPFNGPVNGRYLVFPIRESREKRV